MIIRIISGIFLFIFAVTFFLYANNTVSAIFFCGISMTAVFEMSNILGNRKLRYFILLLTLIIHALFYFNLYFYIVPVFYISFLLLFIYNNLMDSINIENYQNLIFYFLFCILPFSIMNQLFISQKKLLGAIIVMVALYDSLAYFTGVKYGKKRPFAKISPKKSIEGIIGGSLAVIFAGIMFFYSMNYSSDIFWAVIAVITLAPAGDLSVSILKRVKNIKDSGFLIPGHGGILDRMDSYVFLIPALYFIGVLNG